MTGGAKTGRKGYGGRVKKSAFEAGLRKMEGPTPDQLARNSRAKAAEEGKPDGAKKVQSEGKAAGNTSKAQGGQGKAAGNTSKAQGGQGKVTGNTSKAQGGQGKVTGNGNRKNSD